MMQLPKSVRSAAMMIQSRRTIIQRSGQNSIPNCHERQYNSAISRYANETMFPRHQIAVRSFSDRLLGHSPMAPQSSIKEESKAIPTAQDVTVAGGVWAPTSAKRDKLSELNMALEVDQLTLDDAASLDQQMDLHLADGLQWIAHTVDTLPAAATLKQNTQSSSSSTVVDPMELPVDPLLLQMNEWLTEQEDDSVFIDEKKWNAYLTMVSEKLQESIDSLPASTHLRNLRDIKVVEAADDHQAENLPPEDGTTLLDDVPKAITLYRLHLALAAAERLKESWSPLTTISDAARDRAAVVVQDNNDSSNLLGDIHPLPFMKTNQVLRSYLLGTASERVDAWWDLVDHDGDALLEKDEMESVTYHSLAPVQSALVAFVEQALEAHPVRAKLLPEEEQPKLGWRQRRRERVEKKRLQKMFANATKNHFEEEVETPHRLRCIYAWSNKEHQDNKIDSVLIEASGWSGRKRYVELEPKISLDEFRSVQSIHFTHLDRVGWEIVKSFREDLWVAQGTQRQNQELMRECLIFLAIVSGIDYAIITM